MPCTEQQMENKCEGAPFKEPFYTQRTVVIRTGPYNQALCSSYTIYDIMHVNLKENKTCSFSFDIFLEVHRL